MTSTPRQPLLFLGHGNPMNALRDNAFTAGWRNIGKEVLAHWRPRAVLAISAHWYVGGTRVTAMDMPRTLHDFGGFPPELFRYQYPARGEPQLAARVADLLKPVEVGMDDAWGLDHGTWAVLCHVFPEADIPVVQLSIDAARPPSFHYLLARQLAPLRDEGVLIVGSGNIVHNLRDYAWHQPSIAPAGWAVRFEETIRQRLLDGDDESLLHPELFSDDARLAVPTPEHYLPLVYILGLRHAADNVTFPVEGFEGGTISMLSVRLG